MLLTMVATALLSTSTPSPQATPPREPVQGGSIEVNGHRRKWDPERIVCRNMDQPGSRLNTKRVCRSMLEWASDRREDQQLLIQKQYNGAP